MAARPRDPRLADVLARRRKGQTFEEIGRALGISRQRAHQLHRLAEAGHVTDPLEAERAELAERAALRGAHIEYITMLRHVWLTPLHELDG